VDVILFVKESLFPGYESIRVDDPEQREIILVIDPDQGIAEAKVIVDLSGDLFLECAFEPTFPGEIFQIRGGFPLVNSEKFRPFCNSQALLYQRQKKECE